MSEPVIALTAADRTAAAFASVTKRFDGLQSKASALSAPFAKLNGALVALGAIGAVAALKGAVDSADALAKLSQRAAVSVEALSTLQFAASLADTDVKQLADGLRQLNVRMADAQRGTGEGLGAFKALNLELESTPGILRPTEDVLLDIADRFAGFADGANKTALAVKIFGDAGANLVPFLNQGRAGIQALREEAERLGLKLGTDVARDAERFNDNLSTLGRSVSALGKSIAEKFLPPLVQITDQMRLAAEKGGLWAAAMAGVRESFAQLFLAQSTVAGAGGTIDTINAAIIEQIQLIERLETTEARRGTRGALNRPRQIQAAKAELERLKQESIKAQILAQFDRPGGLNEGVTKPAAPGLANPNDSEGKASAAFLDGLKKKILALEENEYAVLRLEAAQKKVAESAEPLIQQLERETRFRAELKEGQERDAKAAEAEMARRIGLVNGVADYVEQLEIEARMLGLTAENRLVGIQLLKLEEAGIAKTSAEYAAAAERIEEAVAKVAGAKLFTDTRSPLETVRQEIERIRDLYVKGAIDADTFERAIAKLNEEFTKQATAGNKAKSAAEELGLTFSSAFEDAIVGGNKLSDVLKGLEKDLVRLVLRKNVTEPLADSLGSLFKPSGKDGGGGLGGLIQTGASFLTNFFKASGGPVNAGQTYLVGEQGPELFTPPRAGNITPNHMLGRTSSRPINITINMPANANRDTAMQAAARVGQAAQLALRRNG